MVSKHKKVSSTVFGKEVGATRTPTYNGKSERRHDNIARAFMRLY